MVCDDSVLLLDRADFVRPLAASNLFTSIVVGRIVPLRACGVVHSLRQHFLGLVEIRTLRPIVLNEDPLPSWDVNGLDCGRCLVAMLAPRTVADNRLVFDV